MTAIHSSGSFADMSHRNHFFINVLLLLCGAVFFALAHPGFIFAHGLPGFAWFMWIPAFFIVRRSSYRTVWLWGGFYGAVSYAFFVSWLVTFSLVATAAICIEYFISYALLFLCLKTAAAFCGKRAWLVEYFFLCSHEYIKTLGFAGFSYGVSGYTQWQNVVLIQSSALFGVWGLTFLIDFASAWIYAVLMSMRGANELHNLQEHIGNNKNDGNVRKAYSKWIVFVCSIGRAAQRHALSLCMWLVCLCFTFAYGTITLSRHAPVQEFVKVCAVQHNTDPWSGGIAAYERDVKTLMDLTEQALLENPDIQLVVWPETAVVPSILTHYALRYDRRRFDLINSVLQFINGKDAVFVIGNFHSVDTGKQRTDDYNSAFVFTPRKNVIPPTPEIYRKIHLVPFTESVPLADKFTWLHDALEKANTHLWRAGTERTVFYADNFSFSVPICFEDTFGNDCREFVNNGARAFVNMSNDAWSRSVSCQNQHLSMAVFRCAENRVPAVRSTASGQTCIVDSTGAVLLEAEPFVQTYITGLLPVAGADAGNTWYNKIGDLCAMLFVMLSCMVFVFAMAWNTQLKRTTVP